jgi:hypothetical protein
MKTMSVEMDTWLAERTVSEAALAQAEEQLSNGEETGKRPTSPVWARQIEFTAPEWRELYRRFQQVGTPSFGFARRIQTATTDVMLLSREQRAWVLALAFKYRRKVFFNPKAADLDVKAFCTGIRRLTADIRSNITP